MGTLIRVSREARKSQYVKFLAGTVIEVEEADIIETDFGKALQLKNYKDAFSNQKLPERQILVSFLSFISSPLPPYLSP